MPTTKQYSLLVLMNDASKLVKHLPTDETSINGIYNIKTGVSKSVINTNYRCDIFQ